MTRYSHQDWIACGKMLMFLQKRRKKLNRYRPKEARDWYMITSDRTGLHSFSIGTPNLQHDMLDESIANEYMPTIHFQSKIISENSQP